MSVLEETKAKSREAMTGTSAMMKAVSALKRKKSALKKSKQ
jgi:hypothetical protein